MYRNKKDVDKHVDSLLKKISLKEFKNRAYSVARLYFDVGDYPSCIKYVEEYLTQKDNNAAAHKLLGQSLLKLGEKDRALEHFIASMEMDPTQTCLIIDICELLADNQIEVDPAQAKYWCEKAQSTFPRHSATLQLCERLVVLNKSDPETLVQLLKTQLSESPKDAFLHARLLRHYMNNNKVRDAFDHSYNVEFEYNTFLNNSAWYETLVDILKHNSHNIKDWKYQLLLLTVRERICYLSIAETPSGTSKSIVESKELLNLYDQAIDSVVKAGTPPGFGELHSGLIQHHKGQLALHIATYLLKKAKKNQLNWREATGLAATFFLISWQTVPLDPKANWLSHAPEGQKKIALRWYLEGTYRCSQSGHYLVSNIKDKPQTCLDKISQCCSDTNWKEKLYEKIFTSKECLAKSKTSFLVSSVFNPPVIRLPRKSEVMAYDIDAQKYYANSLHHAVWILLNYSDFAHFQCSLFQMLKPSTANCGPESLSKLDIEAFLYCTALTASQKKATEAHLAYDKPCILPANITELNCTLPQMKWWEIASKFAQNELGTDWTDVRTTLGRGIEVVRCMDNHGLDPEMLCKLGKIFNNRAKQSTTSSDKSDLETRAALYYNEAIPLIEKLKSKIFVKVPEKRMFDYTHKDLSDKEINSLLNESKLCVALKFYNESEYEKTIEVLSNLKSPQAYYYLAQTYMKIAVEELNLSHDKSKFGTLLSKAKSFADKAFDRVKDMNENDLCCNIQELIATIETHINKAEMDLTGSNLHDNEVSPSDHYYSVDDTSRRNVYAMHRNISSTPKHNNHNNSAKYRTAVDSHLLENNNADHQFLERIESQIKNLQRRETTITDFMDQTREWFDENRKLGNQIMNSVQSNMQNTTDQFRLLKISVDQIKSQLDECKNECKDVSDLKKQIADLKKEVLKLKKSSSEQTVDDSDLYNLEEDYRTNENNLNLQFNPAQVLPTFNQRLLPTFPMPPNPYQIYSQNMYNLYNQYSQLAQPAPIPGAPQVFDPSRTPVNYGGMYPTPEQLYLDVAHLVPPAVQPPTSIPVIPTIPPVPTLPVVTAASIPVVPKSVQPPLVPTISKTASIESREKSRSLPVNVVITSSDPLPTSVTTVPAPVLSVTIPPKHIKGTPHNYQIALPNSDEKSSMGLFSTPAVIKSTSSSASATVNWNPVTIFQTSQNKTSDTFVSPISDSPFSKSKQLDMSVVGGTTPNTSLNKSRTLSEKSNTSTENYDPCPDFKPIVPLPAEVKVTTGEEDEIVIFSARAKLFRFANKEWKERGLGGMKLLKHKTSGKVRVLMRREQIHKICANHIITSDMEIKPMINETKAYFWVANDFADETVVLEKFCVRFKTAETAKEFFDKFEEARLEASNHVNRAKIENKPVESTKTNFTAFKFDPLAENKKTTNVNNQETMRRDTDTVNKPLIGGFTFSSAPTFKPVVDDKTTKPEPQQESGSLNKLTIFNNLTFKTNSNTQSPFSDLFSKPANQESSLAATVNSPPTLNSSKLNTSDTVEEFEPNVEFKPVVPLPALVDQKTGEEDEEVLFEHRAKLLRFDSPSKEWKERGLGNIKLLMHKENNQKIRLLMRREQIMKVCCNHVVTKEMNFQKMPNVDKAVTWCAKDFSEGELVTETFCLRFKTSQACDNFIDAIKSAQIKLKDEAKTAKEVENAAKQNNQLGFGDQFKPKVGSWHCDSCYTNNIESFTKCACCEQPRPGQVDSSKQNAPITAGWGDKFKPKVGSWECQQCFIQNDSAAEICAACSAPKDQLKTQNQITLQNKTMFSFGIPSQINANSSNVSSPASASNTTSGWGDKFKPKTGTWECKQCFVRNESSLQQCSACTSPKDPNSKPNPGSIFGSTQDKTFSFGIPSSMAPDDKSNTASIFAGTGAHKFNFGIPKTAEDQKLSAPFTGTIFASPKAPVSETPINFSLIKSGESQTLNPKPALLSTPTRQSTILGDKNSTGFSFVFKPKSPSKSKSPGKSPRTPKGDGEESDGSEYASEDEGHHILFNPIIPLPDKVEVVTGEEDETELYGHRAKLFIFTSGEWKERGIGIVKILKHKENGKLRVVMRREQVLKICLNHSLTSDVTYTPKDDKTWLFAANDFSEGELNLQQFCLRFKTKEIAQEFKNAVENARVKKEIGKENDNDDTETSDEVVFVSETQASVEDKKKAKDLMLPENFFTYKNKDPCQGCRGCKDDDAEGPSLKPTSLFSKVLSTTTSTPVKSTVPVQSQTSSIVGTPQSGDRILLGDTSVYRTPLGSGFNTKQATPSSSLAASFSSDTMEKENNVLPQPNIFQSSKQSIFASPQSSIFDTPTTLTGSTVSTTETKATDPKSVFGSFSQKTSTSGSIFGSTATNIKTPFTFSADAKKDDLKPEITSIFSSKPQMVTNLSSNMTQGSIFGSSSFTNNQSKTANEPIFGANSFGSKPIVENIKPEGKIELKEPLFKVDTSLSFSALASSGPGFKKKEDFKWEGEGQQLFGGKKSEADVSGGADESAAADDEYDPHYEPIVPLPDKIVVTTGEEDEEKVFSERCKLYRFDDNTREWKERGVGELKILHHPQKNTYRLLLRREQVHKAVLNMLLHMDLELLPMKNSDRAWTWAGRNYAESPAGAQETLAVRFKSIQLAQTFHDAATQCIRKLQASAAQALRDSEVTAAAPLRLPKHLQDSARADSELAQRTQAITLQTQSSVNTQASESSKSTEVTSTLGASKQEAAQEPEEAQDEDDDDEYDNEYEHNEDYDYYVEEEEESGTYYTCEGSVTVQCPGGRTTTCERALVQVSFDPDIYSPKILITDADTCEILADMLIHTETDFQMSEDSCTWSGLDYTTGDGSEKTVTVRFPDSQTAMNFYDSCETSKAATYSSTDPES